MKKILATRLLWAAAALALAAPLTVHAEEITLYSHNDFGGPALVLHDPVRDLDKLGFNDRTASVIVRSGSWEVCEHANFGGRCKVLGPGEYARLDGFSNIISSVRLAAPRASAYHEAVRDDPVAWQRPEPVVLYARPGFEGRHVELHKDARNLRSLDFDDQAGSVVIQEGRWEMCVDADYGGHCAVYAPGRYPSLEGMSKRISSLRRLPD
jgi:hypothetical protein